MAAWRFMHSGSACIMIGFRSDHACIMHKSETDWMHARGQPASARAWPAASGQLAGFHLTFVPHGAAYTQAWNIGAQTRKVGLTPGILV